MLGKVDVRVGCCGFPVGRSRYARTFAVVEVQQTFYQPPALATLLRWRRELPPPFEFTLKAWQLITHPASSPTYRRLREKISPRTAHRYASFPPSAEVLAAWERTAAAARVLEARLILFQCPARFTPSAENIAHLRRFFRRIPRGRFLFAWEPRGDWERKTVARLCQELELIHALDPFKSVPAAARLCYFRPHGITGYRYRFTGADLRRLAAWCPGRKLTYVLFNNVTMLEDAQRFQPLLVRR